MVLELDETSREQRIREALNSMRQKGLPESMINAMGRILRRHKKGTKSRLNQFSKPIMGDCVSDTLKSEWEANIASRDADQDFQERVEYMNRAFDKIR